jgi:hypothetical protein
VFQFATKQFQSSSESNTLVSTLGILFYSEIVASCLLMFLILRLAQIMFLSLEATIGKVISTLHLGYK